MTLFKHEHYIILIYNISVFFDISFLIVRITVKKGGRIITFMKPLVAVIMGSTSDWATMKATCLVLEELGIPYEKRVISAHRTPDLMFRFAEESRTKGLKVIIGRWWSGPFTRDGRRKDNLTCHWCSS